jgi:biopolymer transport protein ExbD
MKINSHRISRKKARIEIIPLIEIMFFLLATFVLVSFSMTENKGLRVNLPVSSISDKENKLNAQDKSTVTISILKSGTFALDKNEISLEELKKELLNKVNVEGENLKLIILGDKESNLQDTINILDLTKELKIEGVTLRTKSQ